MKKGMSAARKRIIRRVDSRKEIKYSLVQLKKAEKVGKELFMREKARLMLKVLDTIPIGTYECPYCQDNLAGNGSCSTCEYANKHGGICTDIDSDFYKLILAMENVKKLIQKYGNIS